MNKKKRIMKILAALTAFVLIGILLFFVNAFFGNPVSYLLARHSATQYIEENHPDSDFEIEGVSFFFDSTKYSVKIISPSSKDSCFTLKTDFFGRIKYNSYGTDVLKMENTKERINREYSDMVSAVFASPVFPYEIGFAYSKVNFSEEDSVTSDKTGVIFSDELILDKAYDMKYVGSKAGCVILEVYDEVTVENAAEILKKTKLLLSAADITFNSIEFILRERCIDDPINEKYIRIDEFPEAFIDSDELIEKIVQCMHVSDNYYDEIVSLPVEETTKDEQLITTDKTE